MKWDNFTAGRIDSFKCADGKKQSIFWDGKISGLGLRVTAAGSKSYIFETSINKKTIRITIGDISTYSIDAAQKIAIGYKSQTDRGIDPRQVAINKQLEIQAAEEIRKVEQEEKRVQEKHESLTLGMVWPIYVESRRKRWSEWHIRDHESVVRRGGERKKRGKGLTEPAALASLLEVRLIDLTGKRIASWLTEEATSRPTQAGLAFRLLSVFVNWCDSQSEYKGLIPSGACKSQQVRDEVPTSNSKEGDCLQREQLVPWFKAVLAMDNKVQSVYLQALLLTGARRRELASLRWEDVGFQWRSITIRDKVEGERTIPLCPYISSQISTLPKKSEWVFASARSKNGYIAEPTKGHKAALDSAGLPNLTLHGLRRSFGSLAEWTDTPTGVVAQIMGHKPSALAEKHYRRRPIDLLRVHHDKLESWILEQAKIEFKSAESKFLEAK